MKNPLYRYNIHLVLLGTLILGLLVQPISAGGPLNPKIKETQNIHLKDQPKAQEIMNNIAQGLAKNEINVALLGGKTYMVNNCLGIKASAGKFGLRLANPDFHFQGTGAVLTFAVDRISMSALRVRTRPNPTNPANPCHFGKAFEIGGSASNVRLEMKFDPILDVQQCKVGTIGMIHTKWRIGGLNLKPLQNDLDKAAKNMIEDSLTYLSENTGAGSIVNQIIRSINDTLELDCPAKKGPIN